MLTSVLPEIPFQNGGESNFMMEGGTNESK
jgi:hypothetical protein